MRTLTIKYFVLFLGLLVATYLLPISANQEEEEEEGKEESIGEATIYDRKTLPTQGVEGTFYIYADDLKYNLSDYRGMDRGIK